MSKAKTTKPGLVDGLHPLYRAAVQADDLFQRALETVYGKAGANAARYLPKHDDELVREAKALKGAADEAWAKAIQAHRIESNRAIREGLR